MCKINGFKCPESVIVTEKWIERDRENERDRNIDLKRMNGKIISNDSIMIDKLSKMSLTLLSFTVQRGYSIEKKVFENCVKN